MPETAWFTYDDFADRVGEQFRVKLPAAETIPLVLADVTERPQPGGTGPDGTPRQQFSLLFRGPAAPELGQGLWELGHDELHELALFLVPLGPDADGPRYEAVFA